MSLLSNLHEPAVLVVDDDPMVLELLVTRLTLAGYRTASARNGGDAISRLKDVQPAAMVLDINMPGLDGFGVLDYMRRTSSVKMVPTLVLTARNRTEDVQKAIGLGARDFMSKPFKDEQLLKRVARLMRKPGAATPAPTSPAVDTKPTPDDDDSLIL